MRSKLTFYRQIKKEELKTGTVAFLESRDEDRNVIYSRVGITKATISCGVGSDRGLWVRFKYLDGDSEGALDSAPMKDIKVYDASAG